MIFTATKHLSFNKKMSGAGLLPFDKKRVLTAENCNKATWKYNKVYDPKHILCSRKNQANNPRKGIYYAGIWQELGLAESEDCTEWAREMLTTEG